MRSAPATSEFLRPGWLPESEFPFSVHSVDLHARRVRYVDEGAGPVLLFVHAGPAWMFVFRDLILALREDFRCLALDLPGSGLSPAAPGPRLDLRGAVEVLESFVEALDLPPATVVAHDLGAPVSLLAMGRHPERFLGLAVTEGFAWSLQDHNPKVARMLRFVGGRTMRSLVAATNVLHRATSTSAGVGRRLGKAGRRAFRGPFRDRAVRAQALAMLGEAGRAGEWLTEAERALRERLSGRPVLLVFGERSPVMKEDFPDRWRERVPDAELHVVERGHHFPMADDPGGVARRIREWHRARVAEGG